MSEYQYYEFQTVDRLLSSTQMAEIRKLSSRVVLSSSRAAFNYSYGSFRSDPMDVLDEYFDILLYIANWGSKQLAMRFPKAAIEAAQIQPYLLGDEESYVGDLLTTSDHLILNLEIREEGGYGWIEGEGLLDPLIPLRDAMLRGDMRMLYLFWLCCAANQAGYQDDDEYEEDEGAATYEDENADADSLLEPPVPAGLKQLDAALNAFVEFFAIDRDLIAAAAEASPNLATTNDNEPLEDWVGLLPEAERNALLLRVARGESRVGIELLRRLREVGGVNKPTVSTAPRRMFRELQAAAQQQQQLRIKLQQEAIEKARLARLADLAQREEAIWANIVALLAKRTASGYDQGVALLIELRELAVHQGQQAAFTARLRRVTTPYAGSAAFQRRLMENRLV
ncbi:hypothetical protein [Candidatus Oscillochloris fontis]|uniref:hypothetical protein n=1 Tax=Candidatus Oscillochloris fontis TaxID=2496868 RepID=UPI00101CDE88|nr:hypothetical protein [Candidatus Oscillochloris fontis]